MVAPAAATQVRHASQRLTSATPCSAVASSSTHDRRVAQRLREVVAMPGERDGQHGADDQRPRGGRRGAAAQPLGSSPLLASDGMYGSASPSRTSVRHREYPLSMKPG